MVIQIRGTSGSGKTWIINQLFEKYSFHPVKNHGEIMGYYSKDINLFVVGKYTVACGGCDTIKTQDEICRRVQTAVRKGWNVLFEGLICSHISKRYAEMHRDMTSNGIETKFIFLSTPLETCRENINIRRAKKGKPPIIAKNTEKDYTSTHKSRKNMSLAGVPIRDMPKLSSSKALSYILDLLEESK